MEEKEFQSIYIKRLIGIFKEEKINNETGILKSISGMVNSKRMLDLYYKNKEFINKRVFDE